jgi:hypothetical protein
VFGAFVLPTVLIGMISISFDQSTARVKARHMLPSLRTPSPACGAA